MNGSKLEAVSLPASARNRSENPFQAVALAGVWFCPDNGSDAHTLPDLIQQADRLAIAAQRADDPAAAQRHYQIESVLKVLHQHWQGRRVW